MSTVVNVAVTQLRPRKGDYAGNLSRLGTVFARLDALPDRPAVIVLPETALTGYFLEGGVREHAVTAGTLARDLDACYRAAVTGARSVDVVVGFYEVWRNTLYNSAMYVTLGAGEPVIHHVHRKLFLPTYGLFDEERFVERGRDIRAFDTPWGRAAMLICEDAWHSMTGTIAALDGAQMIFVVSAAPARGAWPKDDGVPGPASVSRWERLIREIADEHGVYIALSNLVGSEGGKIFPGASLLIGPKGEVRGRGPLWEESVVCGKVELGDSARARADTPLIADLEVMIPHLRASMDAAIGHLPVRLEYDPAPPAGTKQKRAKAASRPAVADSDIRVVEANTTRESPPTPLEIDPAMTADWLVHFIKEELDRRHFTKVVIGISGGVDSAVVASLAARAIGPANVIGVRIPYKSSSRESLDHAQLVIDALGIQSRTVDITAAVDGYLQHEPDASGGRRGNVMARMRMITIFDLAAKHEAIPLGTGNKTERLFGYFTWHADDSPPVNPIGDLFKTQVFALARHLGIPSVIVDKPPTADLVAGQTDEGDFGISYARADEILNWIVSGYDGEELVAHGFDAAEVELVRKRLDGTHWKRRLPTVAMISPTAIGESYLRPVDY
ncbi:MAG TPA: NAD+ synthase [Gemmatimonadaceae bacterium]|nr:NAD+ synthase [Gemmatimonadaceae bacterium]